MAVSEKKGKNVHNSIYRLEHYSYDLYCKSFRLRSYEYRTRCTQFQYYYYIAYFFVHSLANWLYFSLSVLKILAISGTKGSSGLGSQSREQTESKTLLIVKAGDHCDLKMSRQIEPLELMFGW